ncbi:MAG TPA: CRISPR-associated RAMP protein Csx7 [Ktedonobacterales bacterium]|nr:CRISPR-associated RAMP protein Csx7 [Ktedonobacterales bacterium]
MVATFVFTGSLVMGTALHIGGGKATLSSDSPVALAPDQKPYIPGSSFKGALRSTVEKMAANLPGFTSCALIELSADELKEALPRGKELKALCPTIRQKSVFARRQSAEEDQTRLTSEIFDTLCDTCQLFGSPFAASRVNVSDLYTTDDDWSGVLQVRDGVAIDRDTEKARDRLKYDFEVVPASAAFALQILLENATKKDLQLLCVGLSEFAHGFGVVGGKRSRGLGVAKLEGLEVSALELFTEGVNEQPVEDAERRRRLRQYLIKNEFSKTVDGAEFLEAYIGSIFE